MREPDCLPGPGDPSKAVDGLVRDPATATWTLRFDREFVVKCVPLIAPSSSSEQGGGGGGGGGKERGEAGGRRARPSPPPPSASSSPPFASAPGPDALAYVIRESARAGKIDAELAVSMGVTRGPMMAELKAGRSVTVAVPRPPPGDEGPGWDEPQGGAVGREGGAGGAEAAGGPETRVVQPEEVVSPERPGRVVAFLGDPLPPRSDAETLLPPSPLREGGGGGEGRDREGAAEELARAAALAAFEAVLAVAGEADLFVAGAGSAAAAAEVADRAGASALVLTRFGKGDTAGSGDDEDDDDDDDHGSVGGGEEKPQQQQQQQRRKKKRYGDEDIAAEARAVLAARGAAPRLSAKVAAARDLDVVVMPRREAELVKKP